MLHISRRARLMLDLLFVVAVIAGLVSAAGVGMQLATWRGIAVALAIGGAGACWVTWRREGGEREWVVVALIGFAATASLVGDGPGTLPLFFVCLTVLVVEHGARAGLLASLALAAGGVVIMALAYGQPLGVILAQTVGMAILLALGLLVGQLLREADQARRENARLLEELRGSFESEKDHVLAQERARAASDLHDGLGHQLTAIRMGLDFAARMRERDPRAAWDEVERARDLSLVALDRMRVWVRALDPVSVGELTGTAAFEAVADAFRGTGLEVEVTTTGPERELDRETALFGLRVVQEGLTNALRHAAARRVELVVDHGDLLTLSLTDDGAPAEGEDAAVDPGDDAVPVGYGLRALADRAEGLGGRLEAGWTEAGFRLRATVPVAERAAADHRAGVDA